MTTILSFAKSLLAYTINIINYDASVNYYTEMPPMIHNSRIKININSLILEKDLKEIPNNKKSTIIKAIMIKNIILDAKNILRVSSNSKGSALITVASKCQDIYTGSVLVTFTINPNISF